MRILLIEDELSIAKSIKMSLHSDGLYVDTSDLGADGIDLSRTYQYDLIILDLNMRDMSGFEIVRCLRKEKRHTPILALAKSAAIESQVRALDLGADDYMTKPFYKQELVARAKALVRRSHGHSNPAITTGPMTVNVAAKTVTINDVQLRLTGMEYRILELLSLRRGTTLHKDAFINHLYADGVGPESRTIELFICKLRRKLRKATGGDRCIETVGRHGYALGLVQAA